MLTVTGQNFDGGTGSFMVAVDGVPLTVLGVPTPTQGQALLPNTLLPGTYVLFVSKGTGPNDASTFNLTVGASELACLGCVSDTEVAFPYAGSAAQGGTAFRAEEADRAIEADHARDADRAHDADLLDNIDSSEFFLVGDAHPSIWSLDANGSDIFFGGGNVGIGTTNPVAFNPFIPTLDVVGTIRSSLTHSGIDFEFGILGPAE